MNPNQPVRLEISQPIRFENETMLDASPSEVWRALTDARRFGDWFGVTLDTVFAPGQLAVGLMRTDGAHPLEFTAKVIRMQPERLFSFRWHPHAVDPSVDYDEEPTTLVEFTLDRAQGKTLLTVAESGFERLPAKRRDHAYAANSRDWLLQIGNLQRHLQQRH
jgi:uncharacterized protein YndB with AHSA1/START domain